MARKEEYPPMNDPFFSTKLILPASLAFLAASPLRAAPQTCMYEITTGTYKEVGGFVGVLAFDLPACGQMFIELTIDHDVNMADMRILSFELDPSGFFGFGSPFVNGSVDGNQIVFYDDTLVSDFGAQGMLYYTISLGDNELSMEGMLISEWVCCDIPYDFSHTGVEARLLHHQSASVQWRIDQRLTYDDRSDTAPANVVHDDDLHVLWNHSYEGEVRHAVLLDHTLVGAGSIADCPTASGPTAASFFDSLYTFYPQGTYPVYHLMGRNLSDTSATFELTSGDVYDRYGAASVVYDDRLYVFWKRWDGGPRYILYKTFDGTEWSEESTIADDEHNDGRPAVAVYDGRLYLFYRSGARYKVFNGSSWGPETELAKCAHSGTTPAACTYGKKLYVFFPRDEKIFYRTFDGSRWQSARPVPTSQPAEVRDVAATVYHGTLYLLWGSWYSRSSSELYAKVGQLRGDRDMDGDVDLNDLARFATCLNGPGEETLTGCEPLDFEFDMDVDLRDAAVFQTLFTGP
jgi:hypothetical protein